MTDSSLPLVYSCSGCSNVAQLANQFAVRLDRTGRAEMSCIAGIGGDVRTLVRKLLRAADEGRPIVAIDGCVLQCSRHCLLQSGVRPTLHVQLHEWGLRKAYRTDVPPEQGEPLYQRLLEELQGMQAPPPAGCASATAGLQDAPAPCGCASAS